MSIHQPESRPIPRATKRPQPGRNSADPGVSSASVKARRILRYALITLASLLVLLLVTAGILYWLIRTDPSFYKPIVISPEQRVELLNQTSQKLSQLNNDVGRASTQTGPATFTLEVTEEELFVLFDDQARQTDTGRMITEKVHDLQFRLRDGHLIIAGKVPGIDTVLSIYFTLDKGPDGNTVFKPNGIYSGQLPVPDATLQSAREVGLRAVDSELVRLRDVARTAPPDDRAVRVLTAMNFIDLLSGKTTDAVVLLPTLTGPASVEFRYCRVLSASIKDGKATVTFRIATPEEAAATARRIKTGK